MLAVLVASLFKKKHTHGGFLIFSLLQYYILFHLQLGVKVSAAFIFIKNYNIIVTHISAFTVDSNFHFIF
jgi:hypothetical protein